MSSKSLSISSIPQKVYLASVSKDTLESCFKVIIKLTFFTDRTNSFFSYTETEDEVSLILDEKSLSLFAAAVGPNQVVVSPGIWKVLQVYEGASALNETGVISRLTEPLSQAKIVMIYLSTYNTDLILVPEEKHDEAFSLLNKAVTEPTESINKHEVSAKGQVFLTVLPDRLLIVNFKSQDLRSSCHSLLQQFFFTSNRFFSFSASPTETSLLIAADSVVSFPPDVFDIHPQTWKALEVQVGSNVFSGTNVNLLSNILAKAGISIYYLSTFHTDFILVPEDKVQEATNCLKNNLAVIVEEK